jgi:hypothetical protein
LIGEREVIFLFEGRHVLEVVQQLVRDPDAWRAARDWRGLVAGPPRLARSVFVWPAPTWSVERPRCSSTREATLGNDDGQAGAWFPAAGAGDGVERLGAGCCRRCGAGDGVRSWLSALAVVHLEGVAARPDGVADRVQPPSRRRSGDRAHGGGRCTGVAAVPVAS